MIPSVMVMCFSQRRKPRASGDDPWCSESAYYPRTVNPARAGMIRAGRVPRNLQGGKPRASGDDPTISEINTYRVT